MNDWNRDRALIPNRQGQRVVVWLSNGKQCSTVVELVDGMHKLRGIEISQVEMWRLEP